MYVYLLHSFILYPIRETGILKDEHSSAMWLASMVVASIADLDRARRARSCGGCSAPCRAETALAVRSRRRQAGPESRRTQPAPDATAPRRRCVDPLRQHEHEDEGDDREHRAREQRDRRAPKALSTIRDRLAARPGRRRRSAPRLAPDPPYAASRHPEQHAADHRDADGAADALHGADDAGWPRPPRAGRPSRR